MVVCTYTLLWINIRRLNCLLHVPNQLQMLLIRQKRQLCTNGEFGKIGWYAAVSNFKVRIYFKDLTKSRYRQEDIRHLSSSVLSNNERVFLSIPRHLVEISTKY